MEVFSITVRRSSSLHAWIPDRVIAAWRTLILQTSLLQLWL